MPYFQTQLRVLEKARHAPSRLLPRQPQWGQSGPGLSPSTCLLLVPQQEWVVLTARSSGQRPGGAEAALHWASSYQEEPGSSTACSVLPRTAPHPHPSSPLNSSGNTSPSLCFSFTCSQRTFASVVRHLDLIRMTAERSRPLAPGHSGVGLVPDSLPHSHPVLVLFQPPLWVPLGPSLPQSPFLEGRRWDKIVLCPPRALPWRDPVQYPQTGAAAPRIPALGR